MVSPRVAEDSDGIPVIWPQGEALIVCIDVHLVELLAEFPQVSALWAKGASFGHGVMMPPDLPLCQSDKEGMLPLKRV